MRTREKNEEKYNGRWKYAVQYFCSSSQTKYYFYLKIYFIQKFIFY